MSTLNTFNLINFCLSEAQRGISVVEGIQTKVIDEVISNINFIRGTISGILETPIDVFNALKNAANTYSIICGMGDLILTETNKTFGEPGDFGIVTEEKSLDRYASFMNIDQIVIGGETGVYSGITRGETIELDGETIPELLGISVITNIIFIINNFYTNINKTLQLITEEQVPNVILIIDIFKFLLIKNICRIAIRIDFFDRSDLELYTNKISDCIDNFLLDLGAESAQGSVAVGIGTNTDQVDNKTLFESVRNLKAIIISSLYEKAEGIEKSYIYNNISQVQSTLVLAYDKYEDITRAEEIYQKNRIFIHHPSFIPGDTDIRILNA